jgi:hypothetical protein
MNGKTLQGKVINTGELNTENPLLCLDWRALSFIFPGMAT